MKAIMTDTLPSYTIRVETPDGAMYCTIMEIENEPVELKIHIGKTGASIYAWTAALAEVINLALKNGVSLNDIAIAISSITTEKLRRLENGVTIKSGPEGVVYCILKYIREKKKESNRYGPDRGPRMEE